MPFLRLPRILLASELLRVFRLPISNPYDSFSHSIPFFFSDCSLVSSWYRFKYWPQTSLGSLYLLLLPLRRDSLHKGFYWPLKSNNKNGAHLKSQCLTLFFLKSPSVISFYRSFNFLLDSRSQFNFARNISNSYFALIINLLNWDTFEWTTDINQNCPGWLSHHVTWRTQT